MQLVLRLRRRAGSPAMAAGAPAIQIHGAAAAQWIFPSKSIGQRLPNGFSVKKFIGLRLPNGFFP